MLLPKDPKTLNIDSLFFCTYFMTLPMLANLVNSFEFQGYG